MKCPECKIDLENIDFKGIKVNECFQCQGRWFDRDELQKAKDNTDKDLCWLDFDPFSKKTNEFNVVEGKSKEMCPRCQKPLELLTYSNSGVVIEKCEDCRGVWLHQGEFKRIIEYLESLVVNESASEYVVDSFKQLVEVVKGSENKISEIKDFLVVLKLLKLRAAVEHSTIAAATNKVYQYLPFL